MVMRSLDVGILSSGDGAQDVALGDDADSRTLTIENHGGADVSLSHHRSDLAKRMAGTDENYFAGHRTGYQLIFVYQHERTLPQWRPAVTIALQRCAVNHNRTIGCRQVDAIRPIEPESETLVT